jgi:hypothetical protein
MSKKAKFTGSWLVVSELETFVDAIAFFYGEGE